MSIDKIYQHVIQPFQYLDAMPSKGVRNVFIDALKVWIPLPEKTISQIKAIVNVLHTASLM